MQKAKTSIIKSNLNPVWNEELKLSVPQQYGPLKLVCLHSISPTTEPYISETLMVKSTAMTSHKLLFHPQPASVRPRHNIQGRHNGRGRGRPAADDHCSYGVRRPRPARGHADRQVAQVRGQRARQGQRRQRRRRQGEAGGLAEAAERRVRRGGPGAGMDTSQPIETVQLWPNAGLLFLQDWCMRQTLCYDDGLFRTAKNEHVCNLVLCSSCMLLLD